MDKNRLAQLLRLGKRVRVGVIGDFCLDAYWTLDEDCDELSVETGLPVNRMLSHRYSLGAASNVVANIAALDVGSIKVFGVIGPDIFGKELLMQLERLGAGCTGLVIQNEGWNTSVFAKPYMGDDEQSRFDFGTLNEISSDTESELIMRLKQELDNLDVLIVNDQLPKGYLSENVIRALNQLASLEDSCPLIVDSRGHSDCFENVVLKINAFEAAEFCHEDCEVDSVFSLHDLEQFSRTIYKKTRKPLIITRGDRGMVIFDGNVLVEIPAIQVYGTIDSVGAGDTAVSAIATMLGAGVSLEEAATIASLATSVNVQKLKQTGTASIEEISAAGIDPDYIYRPDLADDIESAQYLQESGIELVKDGFERGRIAHAVFDHDGTISTLREGWEEVMEPMMVRAVLGKQFDNASEEDVEKVSRQVRLYIDQSTGIQTILQMQALVAMVKNSGYVPESEVKDAKGYKDIYNEALMAHIGDRISQVERGESNFENWTIKGAVPFLKELFERGVKLYLASGTDEQDVRREAQILGYAELFEGRIYGAVGDISKYSKKMVIDRIITENNLRGPELATFGDGPVELRETTKRSGITVGIASDEVRGFGLNVSKRTRLVRAGADIVVPDFSDGKQLLEYLFNKS